jgi:hypothetical protein
MYVGDVVAVGELKDAVVYIFECICKCGFCLSLDRHWELQLVEYGSLLIE